MLVSGGLGDSLWGTKRRGAEVGLVDKRYQFNDKCQIGGPIIYICYDLSDKSSDKRSDKRSEKRFR